MLPNQDDELAAARVSVRPAPPSTDGRVAAGAPPRDTPEYFAYLEGILDAANAGSCAGYGSPSVVRGAARRTGPNELTLAQMPADGLVLGSGAKLTPASGGLREPRPPSDGRWVRAVALSDGSRESVHTRTQSDATKRMREVQRLTAAGALEEAERLTLKHLVHSWLNDRSEGLNPCSAEEYERIFRRHIVPKLGHRRAARLGPGDVESLIGGLTASARAPATVRKVRAVLRAALERAHRGVLVPRNFAPLVTCAARILDPGVWRPARLAEKRGDH